MKIPTWFKHTYLCPECGEKPNEITRTPNHAHIMMCGFCLKRIQPACRISVDIALPYDRNMDVLAAAVIFASNRMIMGSESALLDATSYVKDIRDKLKLEETKM